MGISHALSCLSRVISHQEAREVWIAGRQRIDGGGQELTRVKGGDREVNIVKKSEPYVDKRYEIVKGRVGGQTDYNQTKQSRDCSARYRNKASYLGQRQTNSS